MGDTSKIVTKSSIYEVPLEDSTINYPVYSYGSNRYFPSYMVIWCYWNKKVLV